LKVYIIPSTFILVPSKIPAIGFINKPLIPLAIPLKIPCVPSFLIWLYGYLHNPVTPEYTPFDRHKTPLPIPSQIFLGLFMKNKFLWFKYSLSIAKEVNPWPKEFEKLAITLKAPDVVTFVKTHNPFPIPKNPLKIPFWHSYFGIK